jgi:hypothetical protein
MKNDRFKRGTFALVNHDVTSEELEPSDENYRKSFEWLTNTYPDLKEFIGIEPIIDGIFSLVKEIFPNSFQTLIKSVQE